MSMDSKEYLALADYIDAGRGYLSDPVMIQRFEHWSRGLRAHAGGSRPDALTDALRQYAQDLRRNPSGADDYPYTDMHAIANRIDEILAQGGKQ